MQFFFLALCAAPARAASAGEVADMLLARVFQDPDVLAADDANDRSRLLKRKAREALPDLPVLSFGGVEWRFAAALGAGYNGVTLRADAESGAAPGARLASLRSIAVKYSPEEGELAQETATYRNYFAARRGAEPGPEPEPEPVIDVHNAGGERVLVMGVASGREESDILDDLLQDMECGAKRSVPRAAYPRVRRMLASGLRGAATVLSAGFSNWDQSIFNTFYDEAQDRTTFLDWGFCFQDGETGEQPALAMAATLLDGVTRRLNDGALGRLLVRQSAWASAALAARDAWYAELGAPAAADFGLAAARARGLAAALDALGDGDSDLADAAKVAKKVRRYTDWKVCKEERQRQRARLLSKAGKAAAWPAAGRVAEAGRNAGGRGGRGGRQPHQGRQGGRGHGDGERPAGPRNVRKDLAKGSTAAGDRESTHEVRKDLAQGSAAVGDRESTQEVRKDLAQGSEAAGRPRTARAQKPKEPEPGSGGNGDDQEPQVARVRAAVGRGSRSARAAVGPDGFLRQEFD